MGLRKNYRLVFEYEYFWTQYEDELDLEDESTTTLKIQNML